MGPNQSIEINPSHSHLKILLRYNGGAEVFRRTSFRAHGFPCDASAPHTEIRPGAYAVATEVTGDSPLNIEPGGWGKARAPCVVSPGSP